MKCLTNDVKQAAHVQLLSCSKGKIFFCNSLCSIKVTGIIQFNYEKKQKYFHISLIRIDELLLTCFESRIRQQFCKLFNGNLLHNKCKRHSPDHKTTIIHYQAAFLKNMSLVSCVELSYELGKTNQGKIVFRGSKLLTSCLK